MAPEWKWFQQAKCDIKSRETWKIQLLDSTYSMDISLYHFIKQETWAKPDDWNVCLIKDTLLTIFAI